MRWMRINTLRARAVHVQSNSAPASSNFLRSYFSLATRRIHHIVLNDTCVVNLTQSHHGQDVPRMLSQLTGPCSHIGHDAALIREYERRYQPALTIFAGYLYVKSKQQPYVSRVPSASLLINTLSSRVFRATPHREFLF